MTAQLLTGSPLQDGYELVWRGQRGLAALCAALVSGAPSGDDSVARDSGNPDPLVRLEEQGVNERTRAAALLLADEQTQRACALLIALAADGRCSASDADVWALACAANGGYVSYRTLDLEDAGVDTTPGAEGVANVDDFLADVLGERPAPSEARAPDEWSAEAALLATLAHEAMALLGY